MSLEEQFQTTEEFETGASSRTPSSNDLEEIEEIVSHDTINGEGNGVLQPCSSEEPASGRNLFPADDDRNSDVDIKCTPAFGSIGSPVKQKSQFEFFESDGRNPVQNGCISDGGANPCEDLEPTLIQCSPVEHPISVPSEAETCSAVTTDSQHLHSKLEIRCSSPEWLNTPELECSREADEKASRAVHQRLAFPPSKGSTSERQISPSTGTKATSAPKLKELWQRNVATQSQSSVKRGASGWEYKEEEIDEEVLAQLPVEIQQELRNSLKVNRPLRPTKRPSISDFFLSSK